MSGWMRSADRTFFFGRESDTQALVAQVRAAPLVVVLGASGSGKSSLVMGGVLPALAATERNRCASCRPSCQETPCSNIWRKRCCRAAASGRQHGVREPRHCARIPATACSGRRARRAADPDHHRPVRGSVHAVRDEDREALVANLAQLLEAGHRVILTMREEFRSRIVELRALPLISTRPGTRCGPWATRSSERRWRSRRRW